MNKCQKCGTMFEGKFCPECGTKWQVEKTCPHCGAMNKTNSKFCTECGQSLFPVAAKGTAAPAPVYRSPNYSSAPRSSPQNKTLVEKALNFFYYFPIASLLIFSLVLWAFYAAPVFSVNLIIGTIDGNLYEIFGEKLLQDFRGIILALFIVTGVTSLIALILLHRARTKDKQSHFFIALLFYLLYLSLGIALIVVINKMKMGAGACPILIIVFASLLAFITFISLVVWKKSSPVKPMGQYKNKQGTHKKLVVFLSLVLIAIVIVSVAIPMTVINRHNGTYYLYANEQYNESQYFILKGNSYTDESGYSCDVEFDGNRVKMYGELFGIRDVMAEGTIEDDVLKLKISGAEAVYVKKGHVHKLHDEVAQEATCEKTGTIISACACGYRRTTETKTIPALGHEFDKNHLCKRCGIANGVLLKFSLNKEETEYTVTGLGDCKDNVIIIPRIYNGLPVVSIGENVFYGCSDLTSIVIPDSVTSIGDSSFRGCRGMTSIMIPDSVTSIGENAFYGCSGLTSIDIPDNVTSIGDSAFSGCKALEKITVGKGNQTYSGQEGILYDKAQIQIIWVPGAIKGAVTIPNSVTSIKNYAFSGCSGLTSITIGSGVVSIGDSAFKSCSGLTLIDIPDNVTSIGDSSFKSCSGLTSITISDSVTSIGENAFYGCSNLTSIVIPDSVTSIGAAAFDGCKALEKITVDKDNQTYSGQDGILYDKAQIQIIWVPDAIKGAVTIPDNVTSIGENAFYGCEGLTSVTIGSGVTSIEDSAFYGCEGLTSVVIPDSVTSIGDYAFYDCHKLASVTIGKNVTSIGRTIFYGCNRLQEVRFENPNGWKVSRDSDMSNAESVSGLDDPATGAAYLKGTFYDYYWKREA